MSLRIILAGALGAVVGTASMTIAVAMTGNEVYPGRLQLAQNPDSAKNNSTILMEGYCAGTVAAIVNTHPYVCGPDGRTTGQDIAVMLKFLNDHPERRHENFSALALEAPAIAWPCPRREK